MALEHVADAVERQYAPIEPIEAVAEKRLPHWRAAEFMIALTAAHPELAESNRWCRLNMGGAMLGDALASRLLACAAGSGLTSLDLSGNDLMLLPKSRPFVFATL